MKTILSLKDIKIGAIEIGEFTVEEDMTLIEAVGCSKEIERLCYSFMDKLKELGIDFTDITTKTNNKIDWKIKEVKTDWILTEEQVQEKIKQLNTYINMNFQELYDRYESLSKSCIISFDSEIYINSISLQNDMSSFINEVNNRMEIIYRSINDYDYKCNENHKVETIAELMYKMSNFINKKITELLK